MRNAMRFVGTVAVAFAVIVAIWGVLLELRNLRFDRESRRYIEEVAPVILQHPERATLLDYAAPALRQDTEFEQLDAMFRRLQELGAYQAISDCEGQAYMAFGGDPDEVITAFYELAGHFEQGSLWVRFRLVRNHQRWQVLGMQISADPLPADASGPAVKGT